VIKIERPRGGDDARAAFGPFRDGKSLYFHFVNRGKESVAPRTLKRPADRAVFLNIVRRADVLVEKLPARPPWKKLDLGWSQLSEIKPAAGVTPRSRASGRPGHSVGSRPTTTVVQAFSGLIERHRFFPTVPDTRVGTSISDLTARPVLFSLPLPPRLYSRERTGRGTKIDIAMFDGLLAMLEHAIMEYEAHGRAAPAAGANKHPTITPFDTFAAADRPFVLCVGNEDLFVKMCAGHRATGASGPIRVFNLQRAPLAERGRPSRPRWRRTFRSRPAGDWLALPQGPRGRAVQPDPQRAPKPVEHPHTRGAHHDDRVGRRPHAGLSAQDERVRRSVRPARRHRDWMKTGTGFARSFEKKRDWQRRLTLQAQWGRMKNRPSPQESEIMAAILCEQRGPPACGRPKRCVSIRDVPWPSRMAPGRTGLSSGCARTRAICPWASSQLDRDHDLILVEFPHEAATGGKPRLGSFVRT